MEIKTFLRLPTDCFGTGREHQLNLLRRPSRARGSKWMSGSAKAGTTAERHQMRAEDLDGEVRALTSAPGHVCFSLTEDLHGCRSVAKATRTALRIPVKCQGHLDFSLGHPITISRAGKGALWPWPGRRS